MTDYTDVIGQSFAIAVFSNNRNLACKILEKVSELDQHDFMCGIAKGILDIKSCLYEIDSELCEELECFCKKMPFHTCTECSEDLK